MVKVYRAGPIVTPEMVEGYGAIFNAGCIYIKGVFYLFARGAKEGYSLKREGRGYDNYFSDILLFKSDDGERYEFVKVLIEGGPGTSHPFGVEDPRIQFIDGNYILTYSDLVKPAFSPENSRVGLAILRFSKGDFEVVEEYRVGPDSDDKNAVLFQTEKGVGFIHRLYPHIYIAFFSDVNHLISPEPGFWDEYIKNKEKYILIKSSDKEKVGAGAPPLLTEKGWLFLYHSKDMRRGEYSARFAMLDEEGRVKKILPYPILRPEEDYEKYGDVNNVVFPQSLLKIGDRLYITYGCADKVVGACWLDYGEILSEF